MQSNDCGDCLKADPFDKINPQRCCVKHKIQDKREPRFGNEELGCTEMLCLCSKTYCCYDVTSNKFKICRKGPNKRELDQSGDKPLKKYRSVLYEKVNNKSTNGSFGKNIHAVVTYEQIEKRLSSFYPGKTVKSAGIDTQPLNL